MEEWTSGVLADFSSLRSYINQCRGSGLGGKDGKRAPVPASKDRVGWHTFCLGRDEASGNVGGYFQDDDYEDDDTEDDDMSTAPKPLPPPNDDEWDASTVPPDGHPPSTTLLCRFDQIIIRRVLSHHAHYLAEGWDFTSKRGRWAYALLARLEKPLHADEAGVLRGLLRSLCRWRAGRSVPDGGEGGRVLATANVLIVVIGVYFEQGGGADRLMAAT